MESRAKDNTFHAAFEAASIFRQLEFYLFEKSKRENLTFI